VVKATFSSSIAISSAFKVTFSSSTPLSSSSEMLSSSLDGFYVVPAFVLVMMVCPAARIPTWFHWRQIETCRFGGKFLSAALSAAEVSSSCGTSDGRGASHVLFLLLISFSKEGKGLC